MLEAYLILLNYLFKQVKQLIKVKKIKKYKNKKQRLINRQKKPKVIILIQLKKKILKSQMNFKIN